MCRLPGAASSRGQALNWLAATAATLLCSGKSNPQAEDAMIAKTCSATVLGIEAHRIEVEADLSISLSQSNIVGLPDRTIWESRDRLTLQSIDNSCSSSKL